MSTASTGQELIERVANSPYRGAAQALGYDHKQRDWVQVIQDAKEAEESRIARQKLGKSALKVLGVLVIIGAIIGLIVAAIYGLSQVPWDDLLPKSSPASTNSSSSSKSFLSGVPGQLLGLVMALALFVGIFNAAKAQNVRMFIVLIVLLGLIVSVFFLLYNLPSMPTGDSSGLRSAGSIG